MMIGKLYASAVLLSVVAFLANVLWGTTHNIGPGRLTLALASLTIALLTVGAFVGIWSAK